MGWFVAYLILCCATGAISSASGYGPDTWQGWFYILLPATCFAFGQLFEKERRA